MDQRFSVRRHYSDSDSDSHSDSDSDSDSDTDTDTHPDTDADLFIPDLDRRSELQLGHRGEIPT